MILLLLTWVAAAVLFTFVTLSLASGLLYLAEVVEEHTKFAKMFGKRAIYAIMVTLVLLTAFEGFPIYLMLLGILCHLVYLSNFSRDFPRTTFSSPSLVLSVILVATDHYFNYRYFADHARDNRHPYRGYGSRPPRTTSWWNAAPSHELSFLEIVSFFGICVWAIPLFLFLSLSANDNVLPSSSSGSFNPRSSNSNISVNTSQANYDNGNRRTSSMLTSALQSMLSLVPSSLRSGSSNGNNSGGSTRHRMAHDGLIAPSPHPSLPPSPSASYSSPSRVGAIGGPSPTLGDYYQPMMRSGSPSSKGSPSIWREEASMPSSSASPIAQEDQFGRMSHHSMMAGGSGETRGGNISVPLQQRRRQVAEGDGMR